MRLLLPLEGPGGGGRLGRSLSFHSLIKAQREGGTGGRESAPGGGGGTETGPPAGGEANPNSLQLGERLTQTASRSSRDVAPCVRGGWGYLHVKRRL